MTERLIYNWAKYFKINYYQARADIELLSEVLGETLTVKYCNDFIIGVHISLNEFWANNQPR
jgi:hypothetical protein